MAIATAAGEGWESGICTTVLPFPRELRRIFLAGVSTCAVAAEAAPAETRRLWRERRWLSGSSGVGA